MSTVVIITPTRDIEPRVVDAVGDRAGVLRVWQDNFIDIDPTKVAEAAFDAGAHVVVLGPGTDESWLLGVARALDAEHPSLAVVITASATQSLWDGAVRAGVRGVVDPEATESEWRDVLHSALAAAERRHASAPQHEGAMPHRVIAVVSPKGGVGKTMVSVNLAVSLAEAHPDQVALLDLDTQFGDVASGLQLMPTHTMVDVARSAQTLDATSLKVFLTPHPSGLWVLAAPDSPEAADDVRPEDGAIAARLLSDQFPFVVIDTGAGVDEHALAAIEAATDLVLVSTMDVASVRSLRKELDILDQIAPTTRRHIVLNRCDAKVGLDIGDVERALGRSADISLPSSRVVPTAGNQGVTVAEVDSRSPIAKQLELLTGRFSPRSVTADQSARRWRKRTQP